jgi:fructokinase
VSSADILVIGEALIDVVTRQDTSAEEHPGGSPANVALTLGRLGCRPTLLSRIGADEHGAMIRTWLDESQVALDPRSLSSGATSRAVALLDESGSAQYEVDMTWELPAATAEQVDLIHIGSISATLLPGADVVRETIELSRDRALVSYDPNIRPDLIVDPELTRTAVTALIALSDIVKVSDEDLEWLHPGSAEHDIAGTWLSSGPLLVIVTRGGAGATLYRGTDQIRVDAPRVQVVDTVGAGDTLMGAFLSRLVGLGIVDREVSVDAARSRLSAISVADLEASLSFAARAAAITVSRAGANPPWAAELDL